jgi:hypothetical protein
MQERLKSTCVYFVSINQPGYACNIADHTMSLARLQWSLDYGHQGIT